MIKINYLKIELNSWRKLMKMQSNKRKTRSMKSKTKTNYFKIKKPIMKKLLLLMKQSLKNTWNNSPDTKSKNKKSKRLVNIKRLPKLQHHQIKTHKKILNLKQLRQQQVKKLETERKESKLIKSKNKCLLKNWLFLLIHLQRKMSSTKTRTFNSLF